MQKTANMLFRATSFTIRFREEVQMPENIDHVVT
jgi:hypothetical protein